MFLVTLLLKVLIAPGIGIRSIATKILVHPIRALQRQRRARIHATTLETRIVVIAVVLVVVTSSTPRHPFFLHLLLAPLQLLLVQRGSHARLGRPDKGFAGLRGHVLQQCSPAGTAGGGCETRA